ncbi:uncharacterized protein [Setaria viridis]|nr:uncharacterized protein LOC117838664 isoform X3 [Setaria viridis]
MLYKSFYLALLNDARRYFLLLAIKIAVTLFSSHQGPPLGLCLAITSIHPRLSCRTYHLSMHHKCGLHQQESSTNGNIRTKQCPMRWIDFSMPRNPTKTSMSNWGYLGDSQIFVQFTPKIKVASTRFSDYHFRNALAERLARWMENGDSEGELQLQCRNKSRPSPRSCILHIVEIAKLIVAVYN